MKRTTWPRFWVTLPVCVIVALVGFVIGIILMIIGKVEWWDIGETIIEFTDGVIDKIRGNE